MKDKINDVLYNILRNMKIILYFFILSVLLTGRIINAEVMVTKNSTDELNFGDILTVDITLTNSEFEGINVSIREFVAGCEPIEPKEFITPEIPKDMITAIPPYYLWNVSLQPTSNYTITYKVKPLTFGKLGISPTEVQTSSGETFYSNGLIIFVKPESNGICEFEKGENYYTNPEDCPSGSEDGVCDLIKDGICDPDCIEGADPDCPVCGNNICEQEETYNTCPQDCQSQICGDGKCDSGETRENCCVDCGCIGGMKCQAGKCVKTEICGDGICSIHENYEKCKEDCPSGSKDNYCDKIEDNICDPDCTRTRDVDCLCNKDNICDSNFETNSNCPEDCKSNFSWVYIIIGIVVVISAIFFLKKRSSSTDKWKKMYYGNSK